MILYLEIVEVVSLLIKKREDGRRVVTSKQEFPCDPISFNKIFMCIQRTNWLERLWFTRQTINATFFRPSSAKFYSSKCLKMSLWTECTKTCWYSRFLVSIVYLVKILTNVLSVCQNENRNKRRNCIIVARLFVVLFSRTRLKRSAVETSIRES